MSDSRDTADRLKLIVSRIKASFICKGAATPGDKTLHSGFSSAAMAMLPPFATGFRRFFTIIREVSARRLATFFSSLRRFLAIIGEVPRIFITCSHDSSPISKDVSLVAGCS
jgi:hypothetical protein